MPVLDLSGNVAVPSSEISNRCNMWKELVPQTIEELCSILHQTYQPRLFIYRGQSNNAWSLTPTILRDFNELHVGISETGMLQRECYAIEYFRRKAMPYLQEYERQMCELVVECLMLMQHYGAATRLLDWSFSPWIAAYFASAEAHNTDGAIWMVGASALDTISPFDQLCAHSIVNSATKKPLHLADSRNLAYWYKVSRAVPSDKICLLTPRTENGRMAAQQAVFTIAGRVGIDHHILGDVLPKDSDRQKIIIKSQLKKALHSRLVSMNITPTSLFPDVTGIARRAREGIRYQHLIADEDFAIMAEKDWERIYLVAP